MSKDKKQACKSLDGKYFKTRREGLQHMIETGAPESDIEQMRYCLRWEGWLDHKYLPPKWKYKKTNKSNHKIAVFSEKGTFFSTQKMCFDYMFNQEYNQALVQNFKVFANEELTKRKKKKEWFSRKDKQKLEGSTIKPHL